MLNCNLNCCGLLQARLLCNHHFWYNFTCSLFVLLLLRLSMQEIHTGFYLLFYVDMLFLQKYLYFPLCFPSFFLLPHFYIADTQK